MGTDQHPTVRVAVAGTEPFEFTAGPEPSPSFELRTASHDVVCSSGDRNAGVWRGVDVGALLERAAPADGATHLVVTGADDYRVCVPLTAALGGLLAVERLDEADASLPRFLAPTVSGTRSVKRVRRLEPVALAPGEDRSRYEALTSESPDVVGSATTPPLE